MRDGTEAHSESVDSIDLDEGQGLLNGDVESKTSESWTGRTKTRRNAWVYRGIAGLFTSALVAVLIIAFIRSRTHRDDSPSDTTTDPERDGQLAIPLHPALHTTREPKTLTFRWRVTAGTATPDGVEKQVYLVNGQFPGPTIEARSGDRIVVHVHNDLDDEGTSIHWHGLQMRGYNPMDGAVGYTQCPIPSGRDFSYDFKIGDDEHGTFWWHSHSQVQRGDGFYGGLVVHRPSDHAPVDDEALLLVGDWFHRNQSEVLEWYADTWSLGNEPVPDSLLVNGRGRYNCSMAVPARPLICRPQALGDMLPLLKKQTSRTRLRIVNTGTIAGVTVKVDDATLQVVGLDGGCEVKTNNKSSVGILYPGERVDTILEWKAEISHPWVNIYLDDENFGLPNPALNPDHVLPALPQTLTTQDKQVAPPLKLGDGHLDLASITSSTTSGDFAMTDDAETIVLYIKTQKLARFENKPMGFINHTSWQPQSPPLLSQNRDSWDHNQLVQFVSTNKTSTPKRINLVLNNLDDGSHPFHLHGNPFYVLSSFRSEGRTGWGSFNPFEPNGKLPGWTNFKDPVRKDTVSVPRRGHVVVTFLADNPGLWMLHCHMLVHQGTGMATGFQIGEKGDFRHEKAIDVKAGEFCMT